VKSLGEILERGLYHAALEQTLRLRNAVESRESEAYQRARAAREALAQTLTVVLTANALDAAGVIPRHLPASNGSPRRSSSTV
jgi:hypothetical protein